MWIKEIVNNLVSHYGTNNPFEIAELKKIKVIEYDLHPDILGFYRYIRRNMFIYLNSNSIYPVKIFTCAHELGHSQLHQRIHTPFLRRNTLLSVGKIETEANRFAVELLLQDQHIYEHQTTNMTINEIGSLYGIPEEVIRLKKI